MITSLLPASIKKAIKKVRNACFYPLFNKSYSQEGEDMVLQRIFGDRPGGFYVDIGAYHPIRYSNTYFFYKKGWRGINIDPNPNTHGLFEKTRPDDTNILTAIFPNREERTYFMFRETAYNTLDSEKAREYKAHTELLSEIQVDCIPLSIILQRNVPENQKIDFFSIDVEGLDFEVLKSNDWEKFRPEIIIVEQFGIFLNDIKSSEIAIYLDNLGYLPIAKTVNSVFYKHC
jgi:FkbM family methyltransferase